MARDKQGPGRPAGGYLWPPRDRDLGPFKDWLAQRLAAPTVWEAYFPGWQNGRPVRCPFHGDKKPSLSLSEEGAGLCHACGWKCSWPGGFVSEFEKWELGKTLRKLRFSYLQDVVPSKAWLVPHKTLYSSASLKDIRDRLLRERGIDRRTISARRLGWDRDRLIIPIMDEFGCVVNIRCHDALREAGGCKTTSYKEGFGEGRLYPLDVLQRAAKVYVFEGEPDTLLALGLGIPAVTTTGGAGAWRPEWSERFAGKKVVLCYDTDAPGRKGAAAIAKAMEAHAEWVKVLELPFRGEGKDLTDWILRERHTAAEFLQLEAVTEPVAQKLQVKPELNKSESPVDSVLADTAKPENEGRLVRTKALVAAVDLDEHLVPRQFTIRCREYQRHLEAGKVPAKCHRCWMPDAGLEGKVDMSTDARGMVAMVGKSDVLIKAAMAEAAKVPAACDTEIVDVEKYVIQHTTLVSDVIASGNRQHQYAVREGYSFGKLEGNKRYELVGSTEAHPDTQRSLFVARSATPALADIDGFELSDREAKDLDREFGSGKADPYDKFLELCGRLAAVTGIVGRPLLHAAVDLVFHSPLTFRFNGEEVAHGWLEAMVVGDTRCGKGKVAEGLIGYYGVGAVVNGENSSVAGLVGGLEPFGKRLVLRWGALALHDRGLVAIDEAGDLPTEALQRLSRVRSEGVAEIAKIGHLYRTAARTRILWLCNARKHPMSDFVYGVQAVQTVFENTEDIARLDYAFCVAGGDVGGAEINTAHDPRGKAGAPPPDLCQKLIRWTWSRTSKQIRFTKEAVADILQIHAKELAAKYSPEIPLIQAQNIRLKVAKIAAAVAARTFSHTDGDPKTLLVTRAHAAAAARILNDMYRAPSVAYDAYSRKQTSARRLARTDELDGLFRNLGEKGPELVRCLLSQRIAVRTIGAACHMDRQETEASVIDVLLRCNAVVERTNYFTMNPAFKLYLERKEREYEDQNYSAKVLDKPE